MTEEADVATAWLRFAQCLEPRYANGYTVDGVTKGATSAGDRPLEEIVLLGLAAVLRE